MERDVLVFQISGAMDGDSGGSDSPPIGPRNVERWLLVGLEKSEELGRGSLT